ncbi:hypothetical protein [Nocardia altamirensis]|uniref:hypothetical protein n=1 Tax=Nocardia altamirensis TaxID=472158 RepID=UPI00114C9F95|nr:hypothetical protein [Nocardia altamirensis]
MYWLNLYEGWQYRHFRRELIERKITAMVTFVLTLAVIVGFAILVQSFSSAASTPALTDRDAERMQAELTAMVARGAHH